MVALLPLAARGRGGFSETFGWFHTVSQTPEYKWQPDEGRNDAQARPSGRRQITWRAKPPAEPLPLGALHLPVGTCG
jgi:hypothetical protein